MEKGIIIQTEVRLANKTDLLCAPGLLKLGQPYYVMTKDTKELVGVYILDAYTNSEIIQKLFTEMRVYVPMLPKDDFITFNLQQTDLKQYSQYGHNLYKPSGRTDKISA